LKNELAKMSLAPLGRYPTPQILADLLRALAKPRLAAPKRARHFLLAPHFSTGPQELNQGN